VSRASFTQVPDRLRERGIEFLQRDRGFMDSIYFQDPNGLKIELACYKFEVPEGFRAVDVLMAAQRLRVERGDHHIGELHLADAIEALMQTRDRLPS
jgi:catechol-2,3-dioxygenase